MKKILYGVTLILIAMSMSTYAQTAASCHPIQSNSDSPWQCQLRLEAGSYSCSLSVDSINQQTYLTNTVAWQSQNVTVGANNPFIAADLNDAVINAETTGMLWFVVFPFQYPYTNKDEQGATLNPIITANVICGPAQSGQLPKK